MKEGNKFGAHRVLEPKGVLPQPAWKIDNTMEMIRLIDGRVREMLITAPTPELEDIFMFGPDLVAQLHKKTHIMLNHQLDGKRVFVTHNH